MWNSLALHSPRPILVVVGGAGKVSEADLSRLRLLFVKVLAPLAEELGASVVDGGTDVGVMQMIGQVRADTKLRSYLVLSLPLVPLVFLVFKSPPIYYL